MFDTQTDICMVAELSQSIINQTKAMDCITRGNDFRLGADPKTDKSVIF